MHKEEMRLICIPFILHTCIPPIKLMALILRSSPCVGLMHQVQLICKRKLHLKVLTKLRKYILFQAGQRKFPKETDEEKKKENVKVKENVSGWGGLRLASSYINGRLDEASDAVVLEPLDANSEEDVAVVGDERPFGALVGHPGNQVRQSVDKAM